MFHRRFLPEVLPQFPLELVLQCLLDLLFTSGSRLDLKEGPILGAVIKQRHFLFCSELLQKNDMFSFLRLFLVITVIFKRAFIVFTRMYNYTHTHTHTHTHIYICVCVCVCTYIYKYIYTKLYLYCNKIF